MNTCILFRSRNSIRFRFRSRSSSDVMSSRSRIGGLAELFLQVVDLRHFQRQYEAALLPLGSEALERHAVQEKIQVVPMGTASVVPLRFSSEALLRQCIGQQQIPPLQRPVAVGEVGKIAHANLFVIAGNGAVATPAKAVQSPPGKKTLSVISLAPASASCSLQTSRLACIAALQEDCCGFSESGNTRDADLKVVRHRR